MGAYAFEAIGSVVGGAFAGISAQIAQAAVAQTPCTPDPATWPNAYALTAQQGSGVTYPNWAAQNETRFAITVTNAASTGAIFTINDTQLSGMLRQTYNAVYAQWVTQGYAQQQQQVWQEWNALTIDANEYTRQQGTRGLFVPHEQRIATTEETQRYEAEHRARLVKLEDAKKTAHELLLENLTPVQRAEMQEKRYFTVIGKHSRRRYQIHVDRERHGNIILLGDDGHADASLCAAPTGSIPLGDALLGQKLMLEAAEEEFLRLANRTPLRRTA